MKKTILASAFALSIGGVTTAQALTINIHTLRFNGAYAAEGSMNSDATGSMQSVDVFFGLPWIADQQNWFDNPTDSSASFTWSGTGTRDDHTNAIGDFTYDFELAPNQVAAGSLFSWSVNINIPVLTIYDCDLAGDCIGKSLPMAAGPFLGSSPRFDGTVSTIPVPAAVWLFGSGLIGLVGIARRKKSQGALVNYK